MNRAWPLLLLLPLLGCQEKSASSSARYGAAASPALTVPAWYVDPLSSVAACNDANSGTTSAAPLCTVNSIPQRWATVSADPLLAQATLINLLSDDTSEWIDLAPRLAGPITTVFFALNGSLVQTGATTIGTFTAQNRAAGTLNTITAAGQTGTFWAPFVNQLVHDTTANAWFWIEKDLGNATAQITNPLASAFVTTSIVAVPAYVTIANGDALVISRPTKAKIANVSVNRATSSGYALLQHLWIVGAIGSSARIAGWVNESYIDPTTLVHTCPTSSVFWINSVINASGGVLNSNIVGGALVSHSLTTGACPGTVNMSFDGDVLIDTGNSRGLHLSPGTTFGFAYLNASIDLDGCFGGTLSIGTHDTGSGFYGGAQLWGPAGLDVEDSCNLRCQGSCNSKLLLQGNLTLNEGSTGNPCRFAVGACGSPVTISTAAIDDAGALCNIATGDCFRQ